MIDKRTGKDLRDISKLEKPQVYIYIMRNSDDKIKIGKTSNIYQRFLSLSGSNSQGNVITDVYCSPTTYVHNVETVMHQHYEKYRIKGTEWFKGIDFYDVVHILDGIFNSSSYKRCNELRQKQEEKEC